MSAIETTLFSSDSEERRCADRKRLKQRVSQSMQEALELQRVVVVWERNPWRAFYTAHPCAEHHGEPESRLRPDIALAGEDGGRFTTGGASPETAYRRRGHRLKDCWRLLALIQTCAQNSRFEFPHLASRSSLDSEQFEGGSGGSAVAIASRPKFPMSCQ
jgi:hypothetical protein